MEFALDESYVCNLLTVADALNANVCQTVDLKVKIVTKGENKQVIIHNGKIKYKVGCITADETQSMKLVLWENTINKVTTGKSYLLKHLKVCTFDDIKFVNTNESTVIHEVDDIDNITLPRIKLTLDNLRRL